MEEDRESYLTSFLPRYLLFYIDSLKFSDFRKACEEIGTTDEKQLMRAFNQFDINGDGFITVSELYKMMTTVG